MSGHCDSRIRLGAVNTIAPDSHQMLAIGEITDPSSRGPSRGEWPLFRFVAAGLRFALSWRASRRRELMAMLEKYRLLAEDFRSRAELPSLNGQRSELLAYATHFEKCIADIRRSNPMLFH